MSKKLVIDASNLRLGGGKIHLERLLKFANPQLYGFQKVIVFGGKNLLESLPNQEWLDFREVSCLDRSFLHRLKWQHIHLEKYVEFGKDLLFVPGGLYLGKHRPFVTMFQNMQVFEKREIKREGFGKDRLRLQLLKFGQAKSFKNCTGLICLSNYARDYLKQFYPKLLKDKAFRTIPHGITKAKQYTRDYRFNEKIKILYVSTVKQYKHQWNLIKAVALLKKRGFPLELHLIGSGDRRALKKMHKIMQEKSSLGEFVQYHGHLDHLETLDWYIKADLFAYPSSCENLPIILLEAMSAGLPIVCSNRGPMPEILRDAGIYFNPEDPDSIAESLNLILLEESLRQTLGKNAQSLSKNYSWERCANETISYLSSVYKNINL